MNVAKFTACLLLLALAGCMPIRNASISIPIRSADGKSHERALARISISELTRRMDGFRIEQLAFYAAGRDPIGHQVVDTNQDGRPDQVALVLAVAGDGSTRILATCPGPRAAGPEMLDASLPQASADFAESKR